MWRLLKLNEIAIIKGGKRIPKGKKLQDSPSPFPYLRVTDFSDDGTIDKSNLKFISEDIFQSIKNYTISSNDIYVSIAGSIGKTGIVPVDLDGANLTENAAKIVLNEDIDKNYILYALKCDNAKKQMLKGMKATAQPKLSLQRLGEITIPLPPLSEQQRIVAKLDAAFAEIERNIKIYQSKLDMHKSILATALDKYFVPQLDGNQVTKLSDVIRRITYGFTNPMPSSEEGKFMVTAKNVRNGKIDYENVRFTTPEAFEGLLTEKSKPSVGDVLLTKDGTLGRLAVVDRDDICVNQSVAVISPSVELNPQFLKWQLSSPFFQRKMISEAGGTTIKHFYITRVDKMELFVPSTAEQHEIIAYFDDLDELSHLYGNLIDKMLHNYNALKSSLLAQELQSEAA